MADSNHPRSRPRESIDGRGETSLQRVKDGKEGEKEICVTLLEKKRGRKKRKEFPSRGKGIRCIPSKELRKVVKNGRLNGGCEKSKGKEKSFGCSEVVQKEPKMGKKTHGSPKRRGEKNL